MGEYYDVVVIGAGLGGLAAAVRAAQAGRSVLVLEQHAVPGGYAHSFRRGKFQFDVSLHAMDGVSPGGWAYGPLKQLGALGRLSFTRLDPFYSVHRGTLKLSVPADMLAYEQMLTDLYPSEVRAIRALLDECTAVFRDFVRILHDKRRYGVEFVQRDAARVYPQGFRAMTQTWKAMMDRHRLSDEAQTTISGIWHGYLGLPPSQLNAAHVAVVLTSYHLYGAYYPQGGSMAISRTLEALLKEREARILYRQRVTSIGVENGRAREVLTASGGRFLAGTVVSNANAPDTLLAMLPENALPEVYANRVRRMRGSISIATLYLGLNREPANLPRHLLIGDDDGDLNGHPRLDVVHEHVLRGDFERIPLSVTTYSKLDPECAPAGCSVVAVSALAPWDYADVWGTGGNLEGYSKSPNYRAVKAEVERVLLERLDNVIGGLSRSVEYSELSTPLTNVRYTGNRQGAVYGSEQSVHAMYGNRLEPATPIPNLFLAGAWAQFGGGQSAALMSGVEAGELAARACA